MQSNTDEIIINASFTLINRALNQEEHFEIDNIKQIIFEKMIDDLKELGYEIKDKRIEAA